MKFGIDYGIIYAVYCIVSKEWYIGQTTRDFDVRKKEHIYDSYNESDLKGYNCVFHCAIRKYGIENFIWFIIEDNIPVPYHFEGRKKISDCKAIDEREIYWIADKNSYKQGYNMTTGGRAPSFTVCCIPICQYTKEGKKVGEYESIGEASRLTGIDRRKISACLIGRNKSAGDYIWKYASDDNPEQIEEYNVSKGGIPKKPICQYTKDGILVGKYESISEAFYKTGISIYNISSCLAGKRKSAGNYLWKYASDDNPEQIEKYNGLDKSPKSIYQYKDGKQIGCYNSIYKASHLTGISKGNISSCLCGRRKSAGGYNWAYAS